MTRRLLPIAFLLSSLSAAAGGYQNGPQSARLLGLGGASTAYTYDLSAMYTNPGILSHLDSLAHISVGGLGSMRRSSFLSLDTQRETVQDFSLQPGGYLYASYPVSQRVSVGLSVNTPFGYDTQWPDNWEGRSVVQQSSLYTVFVQPTVAVKLNDNFSAGAGVIYSYGRMHQQRGLGQYDDPTSQADYKGSGSGVGYNVGLYGRTGEDLAFGIAFRGPIDMKVKDGKATFRGVSALDAAQYPASTSFTTTMRLPSTLSVGLADHLTKKLLLTFDFALSGWSANDSTNFEVRDAARVRQGRRYEDAMAFRVGSEYAVNPALAVRAGISYDETPIRDEFINPDFPDGNRLGGSLGLTYRVQRLAVDLGYSFETAAKRTARAQRANELVSNISGTYRTQVHTVAVGVSYSFGKKAGAPATR